ncbi:MAG: Asp-tRNA(Asn)/Glu-tRNA(Gln) amidotransferase subunit GatA [Gammaproteobacteria bacterium]
MHTHSLKTLSEMLASKKISSQELTQHFIDRIKQHNDTLNCVITLTEEHALAQAKAADERIARGDIDPLTGVPMLQKDIFCTQGIRTSCASKMLDNFIAPYNATVIDNFNKAGVVCLGKTNMDEFAMGSSNENSHYGPVKNPWDISRVPGGSSGGSASAVAARLAPAATGTDTGGSIRQPAAFCGISGLKPTYGRVSRYGMIAFASSLDQGGPMARSAEDMAYLLNVMASFDTKDSTCIDQEIPDYTASLNEPLKGLRIGLPKEFFENDLDKSIESSLQEAMKVFESLGATCHSISLPHSEASVATYYVIAPAEASSNLSRYDGVRYGYRCENPKNLTDLYTRTRKEAFGLEVKRRIMMGTYALSAGYYDAYYLKALRMRRVIKEDFDNAFKEVDVILGPTTPTTAFKIGEKVDDPVTMYLNDVFTIATNLAGLPGLSIPAGFHEGLPIGLQLIGKHFDEARLLNVAHQFQTSTDWHEKSPEGYV